MKPWRFMLLACAALAGFGCDRTERVTGHPASHTTTTAGGLGGAAGAAGTAGAAGATGAGAVGEIGPANAECAFELTTSLSSVIPTVGVVEWSTDLAGVDEAAIEFGPSLNDSRWAPVDLGSPEHRTLLLGMKPEQAYQLRVWARAGNVVCASEVKSLTTGSRPGGLPSFEVATPDPARLSAGYLVTTLYSGNAALILDGDGDVVWWFAAGQHLSSARMSFDGQHMWINRANVPEGAARVLKVSMDGLDVEDLSQTLAGQNHQLAPLPDGSVAFYSYGDNGCDDVKEYHPDRGVRHIINAADVRGVEGSCHLNVIEYSPSDDTLVFSDLAHHDYTKVTRSGEVVWVLGGASSDFSGPGASWTRQHGVHLLGLDRLVFFSNGALGDAGAMAIELELDLGAMSAERAWEYTHADLGTSILGDVQRMPNDNTLVVYSTAGVVQEVTRQNQLVQEIRSATGGAFGYAMKRASLYGPPPK